MAPDLQASFGGGETTWLAGMLARAPYLKISNEQNLYLKII